MSEKQISCKPERILFLTSTSGTQEEVQGFLVVTGALAEPGLIRT